MSRRVLKTFRHFGVDDNYQMVAKQVGEILIPQGHQLIKVDSFGINRADLLQKVGKYPARKGASQVLGLECSGYIYDQDKGQLMDQPVMALLEGGGYSQWVTAHPDHIMHLTSMQNLSLQQWAGVPEVWLTALMLLEGMSQGQGKVMVYGGASGVGTSLLQLLQAMGYTVYCTVSTQHKQDFLHSRLAIPHHSILNYKDMTQEEMVEQAGKNEFKAVFDCIGAQNSQMSTQLLGMDGRWVLYGLLGGNKLDSFNLMSILGKRITIECKTLRNRDDLYKAQLVSRFNALGIQERLHSGALQPIIDDILHVQVDHPGAAHLEALHAKMGSNSNIGKLIVHLS